MLTPQQEIASNPLHNAWVNANAGTGKTKVLTDRVIRLLLNDFNIKNILCLTFTNAAAAEMKNRIINTLEKWQKLEDSELHESLANLGISSATDEITTKAHGLFQEVIKEFDEIKIMTIHGFCQSLLHSFPYESGIASGFKIMDGKTSSKLIDASIDEILYADYSNNPALYNALEKLVTSATDFSLKKIFKEAIENRTKLGFDLNVSAQNLPLSYEKIDELNRIKKDEDEAKILKQFKTSQNKNLLEIKAIFTQGNDTEQESAGIIAEYLEAKNTHSHSAFFEGKEQNPVQKASDPAQFSTKISRMTDESESFKQLTKLFLTSDGKIKSRGLLYKKSLDHHLKLKELASSIQNSIIETIEKLNSIEIAEKTKAFMLLLCKLLASYDQKKNKDGYLDYDDLILSTITLLANEKHRDYVLYGLDTRIDHLLVDEAQDTSPEQWAIVQSIAEEFFSGIGQKEYSRTLFVVGDEKQSIFSFQGASPDEFAKMHGYFAKKISDSQEKWHSISLELSFRSAQPILKLVDKIFNEEQYKNSVSKIATSINHKTSRKTAPGKITLAPPTIIPPPKREAWEIIKEYKPHNSARKIEAEKIANMIEKWLTEKRALPAKDRPVKAGDILVLVRRRNDFVNDLLRALHKKNIPVAGLDRLNLDEHLGTMDMLALIRFVLIPSDDYNLACLLRSPLCNLVEEEALFDLAYDRGEKTLWKNLQEKAKSNPKYNEVKEQLEKWQKISIEKPTPYQFIGHVLEIDRKRRDMIARLGLEVHDILNKLMELAFQYQQMHIPSLLGFYEWMQEGKTEIKRDMDHGQNEVRIMTIHGAKGLQAPIVIMPDTIDLPKNQDRLTWHEGIPFWPGMAANHNQLCKDLNSQEKQAAYDEYLRLLYVALTRAEDELYISGYSTSDKISEKSWYSIAEQAFEQMGVKSINESDIELKIIEKAGEADSKDEEDIEEELETDIFDESIFEPLPDTEDEVIYVNPSNFVKKPSNKSSKEVHNDYKKTEYSENLNAAERGTAIHKLLEILPKVKKDEWKDACPLLLKQFDITDDETIGDIYTQAEKILEHPEFKTFFKNKFECEVEIRANIGKHIISGSIDLLVIEDDIVHCIDYKTGTAANSIEEVPEAYIVQMAIYYKFLESLYPNHKIGCSLLWTEVPSLMELPEKLLKDNLPLDLAA